MNKIWDKRRKILNQILTDLRNNVFASKELWTSCSLVPRNPVTGTKYKGTNRLILASEQLKNNYEHNCWVTFNQVQTKGVRLKNAKGKGVTIGKFKFSEKKDRDTDEVVGTYPMYREFAVFNLDLVDISDDEKASLVGVRYTLKDNQFLPLADKLMEDSVFTFRESNVKEPYIDLDRKEIIIPDRRRFSTSDAFLSVVLHEVFKAHLNTIADTKELPDCHKNLSAQIGVMIAFAELGLQMSQLVREDCNSYVQMQLDEIAFNSGKDTMLSIEEILSEENQCKMLWSAITNADKVYFSVIGQEKYREILYDTDANKSVNLTAMQFELEEGEVSF